MIACSLFLNGCGTRQPQIKYERVKVPEIFLMPVVVQEREVKTNTDVAILLIDLEFGLEQCNNRLKSIKRLNDE
ncbi:Rz1-like lysis system protein LysC [Campylobacter ureolyticus]|uniref:Rz1-like lysis system protein LysC n=1 Tax=Campylobacter curvus TaxID=200 RepID=UPI00118746DC